MAFKRSIGEHIFSVFNVLIMCGIVFVTLYPFVYVALASFSDPGLLSVHEGPLLYPLGGFTLGAYQMAFRNPMIIIGYRNTIFYVVLGTAYMLFMTSLGAYVLSRRGLYWGRLITLLIVFTMFFSGGMIPSYLIVRSLGLENNPLALIDRWTIVNAIIFVLEIVCIKFTFSRKNHEKVSAYQTATT